MRDSWHATGRTYRAEQENSIQLTLTKEDPVYEQHLKHDDKDDVNKNLAKKMDQPTSEEKRFVVIF